YCRRTRWPRERHALATSGAWRAAPAAAARLGAVRRRGLARPHHGGCRNRPLSRQARPFDGTMGAPRRRETPGRLLEAALSPVMVARHARGILAGRRLVACGARVAAP